MLLEGLHIPLTTPFHRDGRLNAHKLAANVVRYSRSPASGLIALSPHVGEPTLLSEDETREVLGVVAEAAAPEKVLLANISRDSVAGTLALADFAAVQGYDALLVGRPSILAATQARELLGYIRTIADRSPLSVILSSVDASDRFIPWSLVAELSTHSNIIGLFSNEDEPCSEDRAHGQSAYEWLRERTGSVRREVTVTSTFAAVTTRMKHAATGSSEPLSAAFVSAASLARNPASAATAVAPPPTAPALKTRTKVAGFQIIAASPKHLLSALEAGAAGIAPGFAACAPQTCYEVFAAWKDSDQGLALEKQDRILSPALLAEALGPAAFKLGCDLNGYFGGPARAPQLPLTAAERTELRQGMATTRT